MARRAKPATIVTTRSPEAQFENELEVFRTEAESATQFFYAFLTIHAVAGDNHNVFKLLNTAALFWNTNLGALQTAAFVTLGRIFDQGSAHNIDRLLNIAQTNPQIFSKSALGRRKHGTSPMPPSWLNGYLKDAYVPTPADFRRLRLSVKNNRKMYEANYRDLRHRVFAHKELSDPIAISSLFARTNIRELQHILKSLRAVYEALWQLFFNGRKPVLRQSRYSLSSIRKHPTPNGKGSALERIIHEAERFLTTRADAAR